MHEVQTEKFTGPLGLLLQLIEKEEMDITEVSLAKIADQYVEYVRKAEVINPDEMADFLVVAAKLLYIKSKALLPYLITEEEEEDIEELERQLRMYKEFLEATKQVEKIIGKKKFMFVREFNRQAILQATKLFSPPKDLDAKRLADVFQDIIERIKPIEKVLEEEKLEHKMNIEEKIKSIQNILLERIKFSFSKVMKEATSKTEIIVTFLALLELSKQRELTTEQEELFGEITVNKI